MEEIGRAAGGYHKAGSTSSRAALDGKSVEEYSAHRQGEGVVEDLNHDSLGLTAVHTDGGPILPSSITADDDGGRKHLTPGRQEKLGHLGNLGHKQNNQRKGGGSTGSSILDSGAYDLRSKSKSTNNFKSDDSAAGINSINSKTSSK